MLSSKRLAALSNLSAEAAAANADAMAVTALVADLLNGANLTKSFLIPARASFLLRFSSFLLGGEVFVAVPCALPLIRSPVA